MTALLIPSAALSYNLQRSILTLMDTRELFCIRIRHAIRAATGGAAIAAIGLTTSLPVGCLTSVLFFISLVAGTPENFQAFQLRSTSQTFLGACLGAFSYAVVHAIAGTSKVGTFFLAIPFITIFAALRPDPILLPMPPVSHVVLGILTISRSGQSRSTIPRTLAFTLLDAALACLIATFITLLFPDRASDLGRRMLAVELRQLGIHISRVASKTFGPPKSHSPKTKTVVPMDESLHENAKAAGLLDEDYILPTTALPSQFAPTPVGLERTESMVKSAERSLAFLQELRPFGWTRVSDYTSLTRAEQLLMVSKYEPRFLPASSVRWRHATAWAHIVEALTALVTKVSSLESVSCTGGPNSRARFSRSSLLNLFGEAYLPLWISHYASCATACAAMSLAMENATCKDMFYLPGEERQGVRGSCPLAATIDPRKWRTRRAEMYYGFLLRCRAWIRNKKPLSHASSVCDMRTLVSDNTRGQNLQHNSFRNSSEEVKPRQKKEHVDTKKDNGKLQRGSLVEMQALSFFGVASHSLSEEIGHVQRAMVELAASSKTHRYLSQFTFLTTGFPALCKRLKKLMTGDVHEWEVRFMLSHSLLLITILALSLFLPLSFEASEVAWVFTSAALAAQLSAEPTLFIGVIRVFATITGAALAFGFTTILNVMGRSSNQSIQYLMIPYIFFVTLTFLLAAPPSFRYAAFLVVLTNAVLLFCPRSTPECIEVFKNQSEDCFPNWQYAISRSVNVSIGVAFALFFHLGFWPRFANEVAFRSLSTAFINAARLLGRVRRTYFSYGLVRSEWLGQDTENMVKSSDDENVSVEQSSGSEGDLYRKDVVILSALHEDLSSHVTSAMLTVQAEAGVWRAGPLRLSPLLNPLLSEFIALDVNITELATLLGRRPIFSETYGRSAHEHFVDPLLPYYETIQVSLNNLVGITHRIFEDKRDRSLRENSLDLYQAIAHLTRMRSELRREAEERAKLFEQKDFVALQVRKRLSSWCGIDDLAQEAVDTEQNASDGPFVDRWARRQCSIDDIRSLQRSSNDLAVDDIVLYNTFSFIADGCLSAFVRIAITVLTHTEAKLKRMKDRQKAKAD